MNRLGMTKEEINEYILKCKAQMQREIEIKEAIERRGEFYVGEMECVLANIENCKAMLKLLEDNR